MGSPNPLGRCPKRFCLLFGPPLTQACVFFVLVPFKTTKHGKTDTQEGSPISRRAGYWLPLQVASGPRSESRPHRTSWALARLDARLLRPKTTRHFSGWTKAAREALIHSGIIWIGVGVTLQGGFDLACECVGGFTMNTTHESIGGLFCWVTLMSRTPDWGLVQFYVPLCK